MRRRSLVVSTLGSLVLVVAGAILAFGASAYIAAFVAWGVAAVLAVAAWGLSAPRPATRHRPAP